MTLILHLWMVEPTPLLMQEVKDEVCARVCVCVCAVCLQVCVHVCDQNDICSFKEENW